MAIAYFYDLTHSLKYPFESVSPQTITAFRTALIATLVSSWVAWLYVRRERQARTAALRTALASQAMLTLFVLIGFQLDPHRICRRDWVFPSTFFAEYNWLTFIFEIAPATSVAALFLMYLFLRFSQEMTS